MSSPTAVILAAGIGKRMRSKQAKVLHLLAGRPMVVYPVERCVELGIRRIVVVVGHQAERVKEILGSHGVELVHQQEPLGTGHAVLQAREALAAERGPILILNGDVPLITAPTLRRLLDLHETEKAVLTVLTAVVPDPEGYGRVVRSSKGRIGRVVEEKDAKPSEMKIGEVNTGFYVSEPGFLFEALRSLKKDNRQGEYYLTDILEVALQQRKKVSALRLERPADEILGINTRRDLAKAEKIQRRKILETHLENGVTVMDPETVWIDDGVVIGRDTVIHPHVQVEGPTRIGEDCVIRSHTRLSGCRIGNGVMVRDSCVIAESDLEDGTAVGPFAHLRPGTIVRKGARVGNFVEMKKADLGEGSKANHLSYLGDAAIGKGVNIGAGTITCNYDGFHKFQTLIEDDVFVGSDTQFVAPVRIGRGSIIGAGSTITADVPPDSLALSRAEQTNRLGRAKKLRGLKSKGKKKSP